MTVTYAINIASLSQGLVGTCERILSGGSVPFKVVTKIGVLHAPDARDFLVKRLVEVTRQKRKEGTL